MTVGLSFAASIDAWVAETKARSDAVFRASVRDVFADAQRPVVQGGNMPIDTGFLRASLTTELNGGAAVAGADSYLLLLGRATVGDTITGTWTAFYARFVEYGTQGRRPRRFVGQAAARWQAIVAANVARAKAALK